MIPNLIVPGFPKAASTSIDRALAAHPDITLAREPSPAVFGHRYDETLSALDDMFPPPVTTRYMCDRTVNYSWDQLAPSRIARHSPDAKLIICVRDPIERLLSHYKFHLADAKVTLSLQEVVAQGVSTSYVNVSRYAHLIRPWLDNFPREAMCILDVAANGTAPSLGALWDFLDLPAAELEAGALHANRTAPIGRVGATLLRSRGLRKLAPRGLKRALRPASRKIVSLGRPAEMDLAADDRSRLVDLLLPDVLDFEELTGFDTSGWRRAWGVA